MLPARKSIDLCLKFLCAKTNNNIQTSKRSFRGSQKLVSTLVTKKVLLQTFRFNSGSSAPESCSVHCSAALARSAEKLGQLHQRLDLSPAQVASGSRTKSLQSREAKPLALLCSDLRNNAPLAHGAGKIGCAAKLLRKSADAADSDGGSLRSASGYGTTARTKIAHKNPISNRTDLVRVTPGKLKPEE